MSAYCEEIYSGGNLCELPFRFRHKNRCLEEECIVLLLVVVTNFSKAFGNFNPPYINSPLVETSLGILNPALYLLPCKIIKESANRIC